MKALAGLLEALGQPPDVSRCLVENRVGRDDHLWVHIVPEGSAPGRTVFVALDRTDPGKLERVVADLEEYAASVPLPDRLPLPEGMVVGSCRRLAGILQRKLPGGCTLGAALRSRGAVQARLGQHLDTLFSWWFRVGGRPCDPGDLQRRVAGVAASAAEGNVCDADGMNRLRSQVSRWKEWPTIPQFGTLRPASVQIAAGTFRMQVGDRFLSRDPLWSDLFDLSGNVVDFMSEEGRDAAAASERWINQKIENGFREFGLEPEQVRIMKLLADLETAAAYYHRRHPDAAARRLLLDSIRARLQSRD